MHFPLAIAPTPSTLKGMQVFVTREGQQFGPYSLEEVRQYLAAGQLTADDQANFQQASGEFWMGPLFKLPGVSGIESHETVAAPTPLARYNAKETRINRRLFQTELQRFQKLNPAGQAENLVLRTASEEFRVFRISKLEGERITVDYQHRDVRKEKTLNYFEIREIEVWPADAEST